MAVMPRGWDGNLKTVISFGTALFNIAQGGVKNLHNLISLPAALIVLLCVIVCNSDPEERTAEWSVLFARYFLYF